MRRAAFAAAFSAAVRFFLQNHLSGEEFPDLSRFCEKFLDCLEQCGILFRKHQAEPEKLSSESLERGTVPDHQLLADQAVKKTGCREGRIQDLDKQEVAVARIDTKSRNSRKSLYHAGTLA